MANIVYADYSFVDSSDFTGDAFFTTPSTSRKQVDQNEDSSSKHTMPPVKKARLKIKKALKEREVKNYQKAPVMPQNDVYSVRTETSDFASKEIKDDFVKEMLPDGFEADEQSVKENEKLKEKKKEKKSSKELAKKKKVEKNTKSIVLDCEHVDYDTNNYCIKATGNVNVFFVEQGTTVKADVITYDKVNNTIKAEGNVRIIKNGRTVTGEYIFVDMNEENALIEKPLTRTATMEIKSQKGYVYGDKIVQENGFVSVDESFPIEFRSQYKGPHTYTMMTPKYNTLTDDMEKGLIKVKVKDLVIRQKGDLEIIEVKKARVFKGDKRILKVPALKIYTNKNHDYGETNSFEIGSIRGLGLYAGPGFVFELPKGSVFKAIPMLNYKSGIGVGAVGRFSSGTNQTQMAYGTAKSTFVMRGRQELDDKLFLQYAVNEFMQDWFLGRRRPKYGLDLVYQDGWSSNNFLYKGHRSAFSHRFDMGYYHDMDKDKNFRKRKGDQIGTMRFKYMAEASQNLFNYRNIEKQKALSFDVVGQLSAGIYGTGDTQVIGRLGPRLHTQYKRWMQDIGYFQSAYEDNSPLPIFDAYRYGKSNLYLREYFRVCRWLTLAWFTSINMSGDSPNHRDMQESSFYFSFGPDDFKFNLGYDFIRENLYLVLDVMMNAKGTRLEYQTLEIKQDKKPKKEEELKDEPKNEFKNSDKAPVLQRAVVENVKTVEDVL